MAPVRQLKLICQCRWQKIHQSFCTKNAPVVLDEWFSRAHVFQINSSTVTYLFYVPLVFDIGFYCLVHISLQKPRVLTKYCYEFFFQEATSIYYPTFHNYCSVLLTSFDVTSKPVLWIRIRIDFGWLDQDPHWSGSRRTKMPHKTKVKKNHVLKCWMFPLRAEGFSCNFDALYGDLGISILQFLYKKYFFLL